MRNYMGDCTGEPKHDPTPAQIEILADAFKSTWGDEERRFGEGLCQQREPRYGRTAEPIHLTAQEKGSRQVATIAASW